MRANRNSWWKLSLLVGLFLISAGRPAEGGNKTDTSTTSSSQTTPQAATRQPAKPATPPKPATPKPPQPPKPSTPTTPQKPVPPTQPPPQPIQPPTTTQPPSVPNAQQPATPQPSYAKGQLIVKYKDSVTQCVHCLLKSKRAVILATTDRSDSLDQLHAKYQVRAAKPLFRSEAEEARLSDTGLASLQTYHRSRLQSAQSMFAKRSRRMSVGASLPDLAHVYVLELAPNADVTAAAAEFAKDPHVAYAQPNYLATASFTPNDPYYSSQGSWGQPYDDLWGLKKIQADKAWDVTQGQGIVVAVVDSGLDYTHPDIAANVWTNPADGSHGYNFAANTTDPMDDNGHGTHVAGTIAAVGNNGLGIIGVAPQAMIMAVKALDANGSGTSDQLASALLYAAQNGADVINNSWGCGKACPSQPVVEDAIRTAYGLGAVVVFAAGNSAADVANYSPQNMTDSKPIVVASTDHFDQRSGFSNVGLTIDVAAPGGESGSACGSDLTTESILSLRAHGTDLYATPCGPSYAGKMVVGSLYYRARGTSMAAPHVSGLAALLIATHPTWTNEQIRQTIRQSADDVESPGFDTYSGAGRINAARALSLNAVIAGSISAPAAGSLFRSPQVIDVMGAISLTGSTVFDHYALEWTTASNPTTWSSAGITLAGGGRSAPTSPSRLATWDLASVSAASQQNPTFFLRLLAVTSDGRRIELALQRVTIDLWLKEGFPLQVVFPSPAVPPGSCGDLPFPTLPQAVDLDGKGKAEFVDAVVDDVSLCDASGRQFSSQHILSVFLITPAGPRVVLQDFKSHFNGYSVPIPPRPVFVDVDGDGRREIVTHDGRQLLAVHADGTPPLRGWAPTSLSIFEQFLDPIVPIDLDGDGRKEFVIPISGEGLGVFNADGSLRFKTFVVPSGDDISGLTVADLSGDGVPDFVTTAFDKASQQSKLFAFDGRTGSLLNGFPVGLPDRATRVYLADTIDDPLPEVIVITQGDNTSSGILTFNHAGQLMGKMLTAPNSKGSLGYVAIGNIDGNGHLGLVSPGTLPGSLQATDIQGTPISPGWPTTTAGVIVGGSVIADLDGDTHQDIATYFYGSHNGLAILNHDGTPWHGGFMRQGAFYDLQVADVDGDGRLELIAIGITEIVAYGIPGSSPQSVEWGVASTHDLDHTSAYPSRGILPTTNPSISGQVTALGSGPVSRVRVILTREATPISRDCSTSTPLRSTMTEANGRFTFADLSRGNYRVCPISEDWQFLPVGKHVPLTLRDKTHVNFRAKPVVAKQSGKPAKTPSKNSKKEFASTPSTKPLSQPPVSIVLFSVSPTRFSPNTKGSVDQVIFQGSVNHPASWQLQLSDAMGKVVQTFSGTTGADKTLLKQWDGKVRTGFAPAGTYTYQLLVTDASGSQDTRSGTVIVDPPTSSPPPPTGSATSKSATTSAPPMPATSPRPKR